MNTFALATQISWTLQSAIALTFCVALAGLAVQLKRPGAGALALAWAWTTIGLLAVAVDSFVDSTGAAIVPTAVLGGLTLAGIAGSFPAFEAAIDSFSGAEASSNIRSLAGRSARWAGMGLLVAVLLVALGAGPFVRVERFVGLSGRVFVVALYTRLTLHLWSRRRRADHEFRAVLTVFGMATLVQAARPLLVVLLLMWSAGATALPLGDPAAILFIGLHVFTGTVFGVACVLLALAEERSVTVRTGQALRDAALQLERAHRFESIGRLASGVAHDFNNVLSVIAGSADLARSASPGSAHQSLELREIEKAAARGAALTQQLLAFARRQPEHVAHFDVGERLQQMSSLLERLVGPHITLTVVIHPQCAMVEMDPVRFDQVVMNLVANARDAVRGSGRIIVSFGVRIFEQDQLLTDGELSAGRYACLTVSDTGHGVTADAMDHLFEPFFTTRHDEGGTGLGLATVQGIVRQAGGGITVESTPETGATFSVLVPTTLVVARPTDTLPSPLLSQPSDRPRALS